MESNGADLTPMTLRRLQQLHREGAPIFESKSEVRPIPSSFLSPLDRSRLAVNLALTVFIWMVHHFQLLSPLKADWLITRAGR